MSSPPDFLGLALGMIRQQQEKRQQSQYANAQAQQQALEQQRFDAQQHRLDEAEKQDALKLGSELIAQGFPAKAVFGIVGDKLPESYRPFLQEAAKRKKEEMDAAAGTPSEAGQADIATGAAASAAGQTDPRAAAMSILRALPATTGEGGQLPPNISNQLAARAGGIAAETQRQNTEVRSRTTFGTNEDIRAARARDALAATSERGNFRFPDGSVKTAINRQQGDEFVKQGGVWIGSGAGIGLTGADLSQPTKTTTGQLQQDLVSLSQVRDNLGELSRSYDPSYLKYFTRGKAEVMKQAELLGGEQSPQGAQFLANYDKFERLRGQDAMDATFYYLRSTFTDKATQKVDSLRLNLPMTPSQFEKRLGDLQEVTNREIARRSYLLKRGFISDQNPQDMSDADKAKLDREVSIGKVGSEYYGAPGAPTIEDIIANRSEELRRAARTQGMQPGAEREAWVKQKLGEEFGLAQ